MTKEKLLSGLYENLGRAIIDVEDGKIYTENVDRCKRLVRAVEKYGDKKAYQTKGRKYPNVIIHFTSAQWAVLYKLSQTYGEKRQICVMSYEELESKIQKGLLFLTHANDLPTGETWETYGDDN
jgi:hypothetical protein